MSDTYTLFLQEPEPKDREQLLEAFLKLRLQSLDRAIGGYTSVSLQGLSGNVDLSPTQAKHRVIKLTGVPSAAVALRIPHATGANADIVFVNTCTGTFSAVNVKSTGANAGNPAGAVVVSGAAASVRHDGESAYPAAGVPVDFISGLKVEWLSATGVRVGQGAAYIPGRGLVTLAASKDKTGLSLTASNWFHLYLYDNAGTVDVEVSTSGPVNYFGSAWTKLSDTSRRYLGSIRTDASGNVFNFTHNPATGLVLYRAQIFAAPFQLLSAGAATTRTTVSASSLVAATSRLLLAYVQNTTPNANGYFGNSEDSITTLGTGGGLGIIENGEREEMLLPLNSSQAFQYAMTPAPSSGGAYVTARGYYFER
ncbi:MAG: hypothetical protein ABW208_22355 [Pyrinomonadaceae bacterium]